jgi:hypothetical protein
MSLLAIGHIVIPQTIVAITQEYCMLRQQTRSQIETWCIDIYISHAMWYKAIG